jgi:hypothetical protein
MNSSITARIVLAPAPHTSLFEVFLCVIVTACMGLGMWNLFASMPAYGGEQDLAPAQAYVAPHLAPLCFDKSREQIEAGGGVVEAGCPTDLSIYRSSKKA